MSRHGQRKRHAAASYARATSSISVGAEGDPVAAGAKLRVEGAIGARPDASETGRSTATRWHPHEKEKRWRLRWRVEKKKGQAGAWRRRSGRLAHGEEEAVGTFLAERAHCRLYSARVSRRGNIWVWDSAIERDKIIFPRRFGASARGVRECSRMLFGG
jgi:hypothetical protein